MKTRLRTRRLAAAPVLAVVLLATTSRAAPPAASLPEGFVAQSPTLGKPTIRATGRGGMQRDHEFTFRVRTALPGYRASLEELAVVAVDHDTFAGPDASPAAGAGDPGDLVVLKAAGTPRLSIQGFEAGVLRLGKGKPTATGRQSGGGIPNACGLAAQGGGIKAVSYEAIRKADDSGGLEIVMARGTFDPRSCKAAISRRITARPTHLGGGIVYAFRTHCAHCEVGRQSELHVLTPQVEAGKFEVFVPFEHHRMVLAPGESAAFSGTTGKMMLSYDAWGLPAWDGVVKRQCLVDKTFCFTDVRFEVSWARGEPSPTAFLAGDFAAAAP